MEPIGQSLDALRRALDARELSSRELAQACIARTQATRALNIYVDFDEAALLAQADAADRRLRAGERLPLLGIPVALKDNIDALGFACGAGTRALHGQHPRQDAALVARLRGAGALIAGKVGMHELAFGITNNNAVTQAVHNPRDPSRIPGGSSGGSGAAVAAGVVPAAIGTDTGGSVRVPAALCGVAGLRPTVGRVPGEGLAPISSTRDTAGPLALNIRDCATLDAVLTGTDPGLVPTPLRGLRLGVPRERFWDDLQPAVRACADQALQALAEAGVELVDVALPGLSEANDAAGFPIALYEFVRDMRAYLETTQRGVGLEALVAAIASPDVAAACQPLLAGGAIPPALYEQALASRRRLQSLYAEAWRAARVQALVFPTTPRTAAPIGEDETVELNGQRLPTYPTFIRNTDQGRNASLPGVTLPIGFDGRLPIGLALDAPIGADRALLAIAASVEDLFPPARPIASPAP